MMFAPLFRWLAIGRSKRMSFLRLCRVGHMNQLDNLMATMDDLRCSRLTSGPIRGTGKKKCFKTLENFCLCYEGSALSSKVIKIHSVFHADEFSISKNTHNAKLTKIWLIKAF